MGLLIAGVGLWIAAHLLKRVFPGFRASMQRKLGAPASSGLIALVLVFSVLLMVIGYKRAAFLPVYTLPFWSLYVAHALMFVAVAFAVMSVWGGFLKRYFRHPLLISVVIWSIAHLLVNGDVASLVLFGGLWIWAIVEMMIINRADRKWKPAARGPVREDVRLLIIALSVYAVMTGIHEMLGVSTFAG